MYQIYQPNGLVHAAFIVAVLFYPVVFHMFVGSLISITGQFPALPVTISLCLHLHNPQTTSMPLIEELPVTSTIKASHGWAYVPDTGPIAAQQPGSRDRKRVAAATSRNAATASAKHAKGIQQRLDSLNKENYKDGVVVPIPARSGAGAGASAREKAGKKMTGNVRRILTYQRGFAHYLADEEANNPGGKVYLMPNLPSGMGPPPVPVSVPTSAAVVVAGADAKGQKGTGKDEGRRKSGTSRTRSATNEMAGPATPTSAPTSQSRGKKRGATGTRAKSGAEEQNTPTPVEHQPPVKSEDTDTPMTDVDDNTNALPSTSTPTATDPSHLPPPATPTSTSTSTSETQTQPPPKSPISPPKKSCNNSSQNHP